MTAAITDFTQFATLRAAAERNDPAALREVAGQFEALFLQTLLKSVRESSLGDPIFGDSDQHEMYQGMLDQQLSVEMASGRGIGLADMLVRQLGGATEAAPVSGVLVPEPRLLGMVQRKPDWMNAAVLPGINTAPPAPPVSRLAEPTRDWSNAEAFARDIWPHAERAAAHLNVAPEAIVAQAALETGWGAYVMPRRDGTSSFNLFGIKAGSSWSGDSVTKPTLEFEAGVARREVAEFRAYESVAATFDDYSQILGSNPRYRSVRNHGADVPGFAKALQASGYATDPNYAEKITRVANSETMKKVVSGLKGLALRPINIRLSAGTN